MEKQWKDTPLKWGQDHNAIEIYYNLNMGIVWLIDTDINLFALKFTLYVSQECHCSLHFHCVELHESF